MSAIHRLVSWTCMLVSMAAYIQCTESDFIILTDFSSGEIYISDIHPHDDTLDFHTLTIEASTYTYAAGFDYKNLVVYWTNANQRRINRFFVNNETSEVFISNVASFGIFVDVKGQRLYWTDHNIYTIESINLDGTDRRTIINTDLRVPEDIYMDSTNGYLYWSDSLRNVIERGRLDDINSTREVIINDLKDPYGITVSILDDKIYWVDGGRGTLEVANTDGTNRTILSNSLSNPQKLQVYGNYIYLTDWDIDGIRRVDLQTGVYSDLNMGHVVSLQPSGLYIYHDCLKGGGTRSALSDATLVCNCPHGRSGQTCKRKPVITGYCKCSDVPKG